MDATVLKYLEGIISDKHVLEDVSNAMIRGAVNSGEAEEDSINKWFSQRFMPNSVVLDKDDYSRALIRSLWIAPNLAALDFSAGRLRDFAQLWTDTARGFLGEIAVQKFLKTNFDFNVHLETRRGEVAEFMPSDILVLEKGASRPRKPNLKVSIKTIKFNGRWVENSESQFDQSDAFVSVKLGISRYHFSAYLKTLKTIKQLFDKGLELKELDENQIKILSKEIPEWMPIPAYVAGFIVKKGLKLPIHCIDFETPRRRQKEADGTRPISKIEIVGGVGLFSDSSVKELADVKKLGIAEDTPITIAGIGKEADGNFYVSTGLLHFTKEEWSKLVKQI